MKERPSMNFWKAIINNWNNVNPDVLKSKINKFHLLDFNNMSIQEINRQIMNVLCFNHMFEMPVKNQIWPKSRYLYRSRMIKTFNDADKWNENQVWNPPKKLIYNAGRLNRPHESLLYLSNSLKPSIKEIRAKPNDIIVTAQFKIIRPIITSVIGAHSIYKWLTIVNKQYQVGKTAFRVGKIYDKFLNNEFTKIVTKENKYQYTISSLIAKDFFDYPNTKAWTYPSIQYNLPGSINVCVKPKFEHELLKLNAALVIKYLGNNKIYVRKKLHFNK